MIKKSSNISDRGFTLIELLVVIAIIGILSSVVLASLNTARGKGSDAAIKSNLNGTRAQAELVYDNAGGSYANVCVDANIARATAAAASAAGVTAAVARDAAWTTTTVTCNDTAAGWAIMAPLKTVPAVGYCVDSTGAATTTNAVLTPGTDVTCG